MADTSFLIDPKLDLRLLPYSPVCENDLMEIRVQGFNAGDSGEVTITFGLDGHVIHEERIYIRQNSYGYAQYNLRMTGLAGHHTISVNDCSCELDVVKDPLPLLDGGFIMIGPPNDRTPTDSFRNGVKSLSDDDWARFTDEIAKMGGDCIIIQSIHQYIRIRTPHAAPENMRAHYDSKLYPKSDIRANDPVAAILKAAEHNQQKVFLAVGNCYGHMGTDADILEILERYKSYPAFYGWYLSGELDMGNFQPEGWAILKHQTEFIRQHTPTKPIVISPYGVPCEAFIEYLKENNVFDIMMPQDCVGQVRNTVPGSEKMHKRLREICDMSNRHFWANCEAFNFISDDITDPAPTNVLVPRFRNGGMYGDEGYLRQLQVVRPYVEKIMTYMFTGFFAPPDFSPKIGGDAAVEQYKVYMSYRNELLSKI